MSEYQGELPPDPFNRNETDVIWRDGRRTANVSALSDNFRAMYFPDGEAIEDAGLNITDLKVALDDLDEGIRIAQETGVDVQLETADRLARVFAVINGEDINLEGEA